MRIHSGNLHKLKDDAAEEMLLTILTELGDMVRDRNIEARMILEPMLDMLDELDSEDSLGTEGWRHHILGED